MRLFAALIAASLALAAALPAQAAPYFATSGQYRFTLDVRNDHFKDVRDARVNVYANGSSAQIQVQAPGYQQAYQTCFLQANTFDYRVDVRMRDNYVSFDACDLQGRRIPGVSTQNFQSLYWGDEYGCTFNVPKPGFTKLTPRDIEVRVNYFTPFAPRVACADGGSQWRIEVVVKRRDLDRMSNTIAIYCKSDSDAVRLAACRKPATLAAKSRMYALLIARDPGGLNALSAGQAQVLAGEIERAVVESADPVAAADQVRAAAPALSTLADECAAKAAMRGMMLKP